MNHELWSVTKKAFTLTHTYRPICVSEYVCVCVCVCVCIITLRSLLLSS